MDFTKIDLLIYSSHKTATQTLLATFLANGLESFHIHNLCNLSLSFSSFESLPYDQLKKKFIEFLKDYIDFNHKKLKIVSVVRNPAERLVSSFFQSYDSDEIWLNKVEPELTTIQTKSIENLKEMFFQHIKNYSLPGIVESIEEISDVVGKKITDYLQFRNNHYFFEDDLFSLFVLDFNKIISKDKLTYLNQTLGLNLRQEQDENLTSSKSYFEKYQLFKAVVPDLEPQLLQIYDDFYFTSFKNNNTMQPKENSLEK